MDGILDPRDPELRAWPLLTFYYGLGFNDLMLMPRWMRLMYLSELPKFIGRERLRAAEASLMPHIEQPAREEALRNMREQAQLGTTRAKVLDRDKYEGVVAASGVGVHRVEGKHKGRRKPKAKPGTRMVPKPDDASGTKRHDEGEVTDA